MRAIDMDWTSPSGVLGDRDECIIQEDKIQEGQEIKFPSVGEPSRCGSLHVDLLVKHFSQKLLVFESLLHLGWEREWN